MCNSYPFSQLVDRLSKNVPVPYDTCLQRDFVAQPDFYHILHYVFAVAAHKRKQLIVFNH